VTETPQSTGIHGALTRNVIWNFAGEGAPVIAAVVAIPLLIHHAGAERFGVLSIAWAMIGYFGLFDLGLGRTLTKFLADAIAGGRSDEAPYIFWTGTAMLLGVGVIGGAALALLAPWLVHHALRISAALQPESLNALYLLALSVPIVVLGTGLRGTLAALGRFDILNAVRIPTSVAFMLGPVAVFPFSTSVAWMVVMLVLARLALCAVFGMYCFRLIPGLLEPRAPATSMLAALLTYSGWITICNLVAPIVTNAGRFAVGAMLSMTAVAWYSTPHDMVMRLQVIPAALEGVLFPAFAESFARNDGRALVLLERSMKLILLATFPIVLVGAVLAREILTLWVGAGFALHAAPVLRWIAPGVLITCTAWVPFSMVQAGHRPDLAGKMSLAQTPIYIFTIWLLIRMYGITGAAAAFSLDLIATAAIVMIFACMVLPAFVPAMRKLALWFVAALSVIGCGAMMPESTAVKVMFLCAAAPGFLAAMYFYLLAAGDRAFVRSLTRAPFAVRSLILVAAGGVTETRKEV
jgi:O-antigen/teichoic acid export membrane protein